MQSKLSMLSTMHVDWMLGNFRGAIFWHQLDCVPVAVSAGAVPGADPTAAGVDDHQYSRQPQRDSRWLWQEGQRLG